MMRLWLQSANTILGGMGTYLSKLGPDNLGEAWAGPVDRRIAAGLTPSSFRLRLPRVARLLADALGPGLSSGGRSPVHLITSPAAGGGQLQRADSAPKGTRRVAGGPADLHPCSRYRSSRAVLRRESGGRADI